MKGVVYTFSFFLIILFLTGEGGPMRRWITVALIAAATAASASLFLHENRKEVDPRDNPADEKSLVYQGYASTESDQTVRAYDLKGFWVNVTDPATYLEAQRELLLEMEPPPPAVEAPKLAWVMAIYNGLSLTYRYNGWPFDPDESFAREIDKAMPNLLR